MTRLFITTFIGMTLLAAITVVFLSGAQADAFASTGVSSGMELMTQMTAPAQN
ncbi:MAG: hypothetical protein KI785_07170 [Devosiaceae bacterium]|nr:hypothetical protein [Devosiaceae bacterium MH13]